MSARSRVAATSPRVVMVAATAGLVALASAGTAVLVLSGTSAVAPPAAIAPPLPAERTPVTRRGPVVVPAPVDPDVGSGAGGRHRTTRIRHLAPAVRTVVAVVTPPRPVVPPLPVSVPAL